MLTTNYNGVTFSAKVFIEMYQQAKKLAPTRFLRVRMHPDRFQGLYNLADVPESIQLGPTQGSLGKVIYRVACVKPLSAIPDGVAVIQDLETSIDTIIFEIHGIPELIFTGIGPNVVT